jgi:protein transport protein SEC61 subunit alpha
MSKSRVRLIDLVRPFNWMLPQVEAPMRNVHFNDKVVNTVLAVLVFLVSSQLPIYGIQKKQGVDPLYWMRPMLASPMGTLMEIGVQPLITATMAIQLLSGMGKIDIDYRSRQDRNLFNGL